ncbi:hypothetical protein [Corynebacterium pacaense]|uniref:hypothetical protein n=1 Tax=Corynebacterium pacaense TaxID=1816684 RepID=UPI0009BBCB56|nr:hypothetical protein [Corynebacterium pacaense]
MNQHLRVFAGLAFAAVAGGLSGCSTGPTTQTENVAASMTSVKSTGTPSISASNAAVGRFFLGLLSEEQRLRITTTGITVTDLNLAQQTAVNEMLNEVPTNEHIDADCRLRIIGEPAANAAWGMEVDRGGQGWIATFSPDGSISVSAAQGVNG